MAELEEGNETGWLVDALLSLVRLGVQNPSLDRMHYMIESEMRALSEYVNDTDTEYGEMLIDKACERTEDLLGIAFIVAQSFITGLRSRVAKVSDVCLSSFNCQLSFARGKGYDVLRLGPSFDAGRYTSIEVINAVANYWKHNDDWLTCECTREGKVKPAVECDPNVRQGKRDVEPFAPLASPSGLR